MTGSRSALPTSDATDPRSVRSRLLEAGIRPHKQLGQNFLVDRKVVSEIRSRIEQMQPEIIVEIGPGLGALTDAVVDLVGSMVAVEFDPRLAASLADRLQPHANLTVRQADILSVDLSTEFAGRRIVVLGSLPYRITSPILKHLVDHRRVISEACLITQWEVAEKIAQSPGKYGSSLGVFVQSFAGVSRPRHIGKGSFFPIPGVDSAYWEMSFLPRPRFSSGEGAFFTVVRTLYRNRRKMARRALQDLLSSEAITEVLAAAGVDGTARGETLSLDELDRLAGACAPFLDSKREVDEELDG